MFSVCRFQDIDNPFAEGSFHYVAKGLFVNGPRVGEACVAKWPIEGHTYDEDAFKDDIKCSVRAMQIVREFNAENIINIHVRVNIPEVGEFKWETGFGGAHYLLEPFIENYDKCTCER